MGGLNHCSLLECVDVYNQCAAIDLKSRALLLLLFQFGQSSLHIAVLWGNLEAARALLELGANVNICNSRQALRLHCSEPGPGCTLSP